MPYKEQYKALLPSDAIHYVELYNASEGFFGVQDQLHSDELLLMLDYGIFYEFIDMKTYGTQNEKVIPLADVVVGTQYAVIISTNAGLWRYHIGDTIRFTSIAPYRFKITGRTKHFINVFGEELVIENANKALELVCQRHHVQLVDYTAAPIFMEGSEKGGHEWLIEFKIPPKDAAAFAEDLDKQLQALNSDYEAKRYKNITLMPLKLHIAKPKTFYKWLKQKGKIGGQHKVPRLSNTREYLDELLGQV
jgi:hypothetical protein